MIKVIDVIYHAHNDFNSTQQVLHQHAPSFGYIPFIKGRLNIQLVKHYKEEAKTEFLGAPVTFFKRPNSFWQIPFKTHKYIKSQKPSVVIVQGFIFPLQVIALKISLGKKCSIMVQHHGESPMKGVKGLIQKFADRFISSYLFTSNGNAKEWMDKIIGDESKCLELQSGSTYFLPLDKIECRRQLSINGSPIFLWVGRLNENKDPLTVLQPFENYLCDNSDAKLYMIFHTDELLEDVKAFINHNEKLKQSVDVRGCIENDQLQQWFSAADYFISASRKEATGYALLEAIACGCIPIVTSIPPFKKITHNGSVGFLFPVGDADALLAIFRSLDHARINDLSGKTIHHFNQHLSFKNIADGLFRICNSLVK